MTPAPDARPPRRPPAPAPSRRSGTAWFRENGDLLRLALIALLIFVVMSLLRPDLFPTLTNFTSMSFQFPEFAILSLAMMVTMLTGGIDLSVVGTMNLSAIVAGLYLSNLTTDPTSPATLPLAVAVLIALAIGTLAGLINGLLVSKIGIPPILATLGTSQIYIGASIVLTGGASVHGFPNSFATIGNGTLLGVPIPLWIFAVLALAVALLLNRFPFGFRLYMLGTNPQAARFAGLKSDRLLILTYVLAGWLSAAAGVLIMSRTNSIRSDFGSSYLLLAILVAVLGGTNPYGGFGKVLGLVLAVLALQFLSSGFNMLRFSNFSREFIWGALLLVTMVLNTFSYTRRRRRKPAGDGTTP